AIGLLEGRHTQAVLHQAQREHFGIRESGPIVGRATPGSLMGMGLEIIVHEDVQSCQLVGYTGHGVVLRGGARLVSPFPLRLHETCPLLIPPPDSGYVSYVAPHATRWRIALLRAAHREVFTPAARVEVMTAASTRTEGVKDPVAWIEGRRTWMLVPYGPVAGADLADQHATGNLCATGMHPHPTALAVSDDGIRFRWLGDAITPGQAGAWDSGVARASALVRAGNSWHLFYDGRTGHGDVYDDRTGLAVSEDARR